VKWHINSITEWKSLAADVVTLCVIFYGAEEINGEKNNIQIFNKIRDFICDQERECHVCIISLNTQAEASVDPAKTFQFPT